MKALPISKDYSIIQYEVSDIKYDARVITIDSVVDSKLVKIEGYLTDEPLNKTSKLIRHQDDGEFPVLKYFTKK